MRRNAFREAYCENVDEILAELAEKDLRAVDVYAMESGIEEPETAGDTWTIEVGTNVEGDTVLFVEAPTRDELLALCREAGISVEA